MTEGFRRGWLVAGIAALSGLGAVVAVLVGLRFEGQATLEFAPASASLNEAAWAELLATESAILRSRTVCARASARVGGGQDPRFGCDLVDVERVGSAHVLRIRAWHPEEQRSALITAAFAQAYLERRSELLQEAGQGVISMRSELDAQGQELALQEDDVQAFASQHELLSYDPELERAELTLLRQELTRSQIRQIALDAELEQLKKAIDARTYQAGRLLSDPAFRAQRNRLATSAAAPDVSDAGLHSDSVSSPSASLHEVALATLGAVQAERELLAEQHRELTKYLAFQEERLGRRAKDLFELRRRERVLAERRTFRDALLQLPAATASKPLFSVRLLDPGEVVGRRLTPDAIQWASALALVALVAAVWAAQRFKA